MYLPPFLLSFLFLLLDKKTDIFSKAFQFPSNSKAEMVRLVLVGGGHAHLQVLKALHKKRIPKNIQVTLIDTQKEAFYSGMVPGCVAKLYTPEQTSIKLEPLCSWAGIEFINEEVTDMDTTNNILSLGKENGGKRVSFDIISFDIGCRSRGLNEIPGAMEYSIPTRPISKLIDRIDEAEKTLIGGDLTHVVVVGGGAAGIELAMCMRGRWEPIVGDNLEITILTAGDELLPQESSRCRLALQKILEDRKIKVRTQCKVQEVTSSTVLLDSGDKIDFTHCLWATGASAHPLATKLKERGVNINPEGWIVVNDYLQSHSHPNIFAAGDCCTIKGMRNQSPPPKAGVYAVRSGPVLVQNLLAYHQSNPMQHYVPQDDFLKLLACGDGRALGFRFDIPFAGKWVFKLKDHIDQKFMNLFREECLPEILEEEGNIVSQFDAQENFQKTVSPSEVAELLLRKDDDIDYLDAWYGLRMMSKDKKFRLDVLQKVLETTQIRKTSGEVYELSEIPGKIVQEIVS